MREPKRLAHRQAERNRARALERWSRDDSEDDFAAVAVPAREPGDELQRFESLTPTDSSRFNA